MPVILTEAEEDKWLAPMNSNADVDALMALVRPYCRGDDRLSGGCSLEKLELAILQRPATGMNTPSCSWPIVAVSGWTAHDRAVISSGKVRTC